MTPRIILAACLSVWALTASAAPVAGAQPNAPAPASADALAKDWLARWEKNITGDMRNRYCDRETGEELGWLVSPFLNGFYYGYLATTNSKSHPGSSPWPT